jgi:hypothetical protein
LKGASQLSARLKAMSKTEVLMRDIVIHGVREAKLLSPRQTSNLSRTIRPGHVTAKSGEIMAGGTSKVGYARYVELGTRPHIIRPKTQGGVLAWGGQRRLSGSLRSGSRPTMFAKSVRHPGTKAQPFLQPGLQKAVRDVGLKALVRLWNDAA